MKKEKVRAACLDKVGEKNENGKREGEIFDVLQLLL